ncbi:hypothetical protein NQ314_020403 [Rhamnusium bicolor]|uniref:Guanylate cyclase domain-containing protein n=1 Tax=Rhamnusium bicolor TaxID=1586634 RepID=A0AAV8WK42_9CUCU|nr:hypothetical protein NQ314_020403 [Rhamnusium bicolor]
MLNELYTKFDDLTDPKVNPNIYKVETVGDKYMAVSGIPEPSATHAKNIARLALDMMDRSHSVVFEGQFVGALKKILCEVDNFDDQFHFEYRGPVIMKGKSEPMDVYLLTRVGL